MGGVSLRRDAPIAMPRTLRPPEPPQKNTDLRCTSNL